MRRFRFEATNGKGGRAVLKAEVNGRGALREAERDAEVRGAGGGAPGRGAV